MLRFHAHSLSSNWFEFLLSLFDDLEPLGHFAHIEADGSLTVSISSLLDHASGQYEDRWHNVHHLRHRLYLRQYREQILAFESDFASLFVEMASFQPSSVLPVLEIVDFLKPEHQRIVEYLKLYQSIGAGKAVGRRMGLLMWDIGQSGFPKLMGAALLASSRFSQKIRDARFGWQPDYPKTSKHHDPTARQIRIDGLARIMHLSVACALPPYSRLSGAWLAAIAPFTDFGLEAFMRSLKQKDADADLAAVTTTTGMGISGAPFRGQRVVQIAPKGVQAASGAAGNLYARAVPADGAAPLRASFADLVSDATNERALRLFEVERPEQFQRLKSPQRSAMAYALQRLRIHKSIFEGNEMGVHIGALGTNTIDYLRRGVPRPKAERPLLEWAQVVDVWSRRFLPAPATIGESATRATKDLHREARQKRLEAARNFSENEIRLSHLLDEP